MRPYLKHACFTTTALLLLLAVGTAAFCLLPAQPAQALPEYSAQTGEPCATCHISPSGGGSRGPRGQAWVGSGKPGEVPQLVDALEVLGVKLTVDEASFTTVPETIPAAETLAAGNSRLSEEELQDVHQWLQDYPGN